VTLVLCACLPFLAATGGVLAKLATSANTKSQEAYTEASCLEGAGRRARDWCLGLDMLPCA
jgi:hypothetical protein